MQRIRMFVFLALVPVLMGCTTTYYRRQNESAKLRADVQRLNSELGLLQNRVSELSISQEHAGEQVGGVRGELVQNQGQLNERIAAVERSVQAQAVEREKMLERMRAEIVSEISKKVAAVVRSSAPAPAPVRSARGYEHVVKPGETLSEIASAYNTKVDTLVRENGLRDANAIRAGQKLFIPE